MDKSRLFLLNFLMKYIPETFIILLVLFCIVGGIISITMIVKEETQRLATKYTLKTFEGTYHDVTNPHIYPGYIYVYKDSKRIYAYGNCVLIEQENE